MPKKKPASMAVSALQFQFAIELPVNGAAAWKALTKEVHLWWPKDFHCAGEGSRMRFELEIGGLLIEGKQNGNGLSWGEIIALDAPNSLTLAGYIAPPFGGPASSILRLTLQPAAKGKTNLEVENSVFGCVLDCDLEEGWRTVFEGLAAHLKK